MRCGMCPSQSSAFHLKIPINSHHKSVEEAVTETGQSHCTTGCLLSQVIVPDHSTRQALIILTNKQLVELVWPCEIMQLRTLCWIAHTTEMCTNTILIPSTKLNISIPILMHCKHSLLNDITHLWVYSSFKSQNCLCS